ncbi:MAG: hypothetical protein EPN22_02360 [Nitrospirae bacterium]|nr:MAG: hypothetical protein EPN22_02360 [Nitrospirota bacterium]
MNRNKICPECETEYLLHIEKCADCGASLVLPEEYRKLQEEKRLISEKGIKNAVVVREGDMGWLNELNKVLMNAGIPSAVDVDAGCNKSCCNDKCRLVVSHADLKRAEELIEEHFMKMHPEARVSSELLNSGKCPACGSPLGDNDIECPDCGLALVIIEEDD